MSWKQTEEIVFLTTDEGRRWLTAFSASDLGLDAKLTGIAYAAYADKDGRGEETDEVMALAGALYDVCGLLGDE